MKISEIRAKITGTPWDVYKHNKYCDYSNGYEYKAFFSSGTLFYNKKEISVHGDVHLGTGPGGGLKVEINHLYIDDDVPLTGREKIAIRAEAKSYLVDWAR